MFIWIAGTIDEVAETAHTGLVNAVVTNPTVISQWTSEGGSLEEVLADVTSKIDIPVFVQLYGPDKNTFLAETEHLIKISDNIRPKLPATIDGIAATKELRSLNVFSLVTTVCTIGHAYAAAVAGAYAICPYVARMNDYDNSAEELLMSVSRMYRRHDIDTEIIPASVRTIDDVNMCLKSGCHGVIIFYDLFQSLFEHPVLKESLNGFEKNWKSIRYSFHQNK